MVRILRIYSPQSNRENDATIGQMIKRHYLTRYLPGTPSRQRRQHCAKTYTLSTHSYRRQRDPRINSHDDIPDKNAIPPCLFCLMGQFSERTSVNIRKRHTILHMLLLTHLCSSSSPIRSIADTS